MSNWLTHNLRLRTPTNNLPFTTYLNLRPFSPKSFAEESRQVCKDLAGEYGDNLYLAFSGGSDSLYILKLFLELSIPIHPVVVSCPYNQLDIAPAVEYCKKYGIKFTVLEYGTEYLKISKDKIYSKGLLSPIGLTPILVYEYVKNLGGKVISGQGEPLPITKQGYSTSIDKLIQMYEFEFYMDIYAEDKQPPPFYCFNQNIFYSYLNEIDDTLDLQRAKCALYGLEYKPKSYWTEEMYDNIRENINHNTRFYHAYDRNTLVRTLQQYII